MTKITRDHLGRKLAQCFLFTGVDTASISEFADPAYLRHLEKGAMIFFARDPADYLFFLIDGWVKLYRLSRNGEEIVINVVAPGETFAEAAVFGQMQGIYPVNAQAVEDITLLAIPRQKFIDKISNSPDFSLALLSAISLRQHYLIQQIEQIAARSAPQRIGAFLLKLSADHDQTQPLALNLPYDKSLIAGRLNIQPETFSRALAKLDSFGVTTEGKTVRIENPRILAEFCDCE